MAQVNDKKGQIGLGTSPIVKKTQDATGKVADAVEKLPGFATDQLQKSVPAAPAIAPKAAVAKQDHGGGGILGKIGGFFGNIGGKIGGFFGDLGSKLGDAFTWLRQKGQSLLFGVSFDPFKTRKVVDDPADVNHPDYEEEQTAKRETTANEAAEQAAVAKLDPEAQKQYQTVLSAAKDNTMARRALQKMLLDGRLPGKKDLKGEGNLLAQLNKLATQPVAKDINSRDLVSQVVSEVENPVRIDQAYKGTCGATTAQILLTRKNPAEYVRLISGLASPSGKAQMAGGDSLSRKSDWEADNDGDRSISSRLIQPALMEEGEGLFGFHLPGLHYSNKDDRASEGPIPLGGGLMDGGEAKIDSQLFGTKFNAHSVFRWNRDGKWNELKQALADGKGPIPTSLVWNLGEGPGGHFVQIDKIEKGTVSYTNPWGQRETMSEADFKSHFTGFEVPEKAIA